MSRIILLIALIGLVKADIWCNLTKAPSPDDGKTIIDTVSECWKNPNNKTLNTCMIDFSRYFQYTIPEITSVSGGGLNYYTVGETTITFYCICSIRFRGWNPYCLNQVQYTLDVSG